MLESINLTSIIMIHINNLGNCYGGLEEKKEDGKHYWIIENFDTDFDDLERWAEIPKTLYDELLKYNDSEY